jgi:NADH:ubiquinone oxidoreductase subunit F (NADH-binding)
VRFINGGPALPSHIPPRVTDRGISGRPTLVVNPETLTHAALIARHGAGWFGGLGTPEEPGSALITLSGSVRSPGVYEIECGSSLASLIQAAGGAQEPIRAFLAGGYAGGWIDGRKGDSVLLSHDGLRRHGTSLGSGIIVALGENACPVAEVTRVAAWLADQSAHQCGPCERGLGAIADTISALCYGESSPTALADVRRWSMQVTGRGACAHPDGVARFVTSAMSVFAAEFEDHAQHGLCDACSRRPTLRTGFYKPAPA